ncbi:MAG TPA: hypothetical protein VI790_00490 [Candidatus Nanoarchaeia archaeon]|nr:hypothetical protein [Candidatus Nanoarchaeia archaeon]
MQYLNLQTVLVGKDGVSKEHLVKALKDHKMIKVKFLKKEFMTIELPGEIVRKIGRTIILKEK